MNILDKKIAACKEIDEACLDFGDRIIGEKDVYMEIKTAQRLTKKRISLLITGALRKIPAENNRIHDVKIKLHNILPHKSTAIWSFIDDLDCIVDLFFLNMRK